MEANTTALESPGEAIDRLCREHGRVKGWVAERLGISPYRLSRLLSGERTLTLAEGVTLARLFNVPVETFLQEADRG